MKNQAAEVFLSPNHPPVVIHSNAMASWTIANLMGRKHSQVLKSIEKLNGLDGFNAIPGNDGPLYFLDFHSTAVLLSRYNKSLWPPVLASWLKLERHSANMDTILVH